MGPIDHPVPEVWDWLESANRPDAMHLLLMAARVRKPGSARAWLVSTWRSTLDKWVETPGFALGVNAQRFADELGERGLVSVCPCGAGPGFCRVEDELVMEEHE